MPGLTGLLTNIPKFFYDSTLETRERMYEELAQMRDLKRKVIKEGEEARGMQHENEKPLPKDISE